MEKIDFDFRMNGFAEAAENIHWLARRGVRLDLESDSIKIRGPQAEVTPALKAILRENKGLIREALRRIYCTQWVRPDLFIEPPSAWPRGVWPVTLHFDGSIPVMFWDAGQIERATMRPAQPSQAHLMTGPVATPSYY